MTLWLRLPPSNMAVSATFIVGGVPTGTWAPQDDRRGRRAPEDDLPGSTSAAPDAYASVEILRSSAWAAPLRVEAPAPRGEPPTNFDQPVLAGLAPKKSGAGKCAGSSSGWFASTSSRMTPFKRPIGRRRWTPSSNSKRARWTKPDRTRRSIAARRPVSGAPRSDARRRDGHATSGGRLRQRCGHPEPGQRAGRADRLQRRPHRPVGGRGHHRGTAGEGGRRPVRDGRQGASRPPYLG
jgi:hypothetical protein